MVDTARAHGYDPVPNAAGVYAQASDASKIFRLLLLAFIIQGIAKFDTTGVGAGANAKNFHGAVIATNFVGWIILWFILTMMSQFEATGTLALAFAWLILIAQLFANGITAAGKVGSLIDKNQKIPDYGGGPTSH